MKKRTIIILILSTLFLVAAGIAAVSIIGKQNTPPSAETPTQSEVDTEEKDPSVITDKDTDEVYDPKVSNVFTGGSNPYSNTETALFGVSDFTEALYREKGSIGFSVTDLKSALYAFGAERFPSAKSLTLIPKSLTVDKNTVTGEVRIDQTDEVIKIEVLLYGPKNKEHSWVHLKSKKPFIYIGGLYSVSEKSFTITQHTTEIAALTITGDKEAAIKHIRTLGYNIPDMTIIFTDYRSPF